MSENIRSDETLLEEFRAGDMNALDMLLERYQKILYHFILSFSRIKDIDDILQDTLLTILNELKDNNFIPKGPGTFRSWAYSVAKHHCLKATEKLASQIKPISQFYPDEPTGMPDDLIQDISKDIVDYEYLDYKLSQVMSELSLEVQKLMLLVSQDKTYKEIQQDPWFSKYSVDYLRRKVYNIRKRMKSLQKEGG
ncbi:MAG: sigma factor [Planctomycetota bacterium]|nr:sigma factor [Planctomycetota bacterium]